MYYWQVRKYPPLQKESQYKSKILTWTSIIDIGNIYNGQPLTAEEYLSVENKYVKAMHIYMNYMKVTDMEVYLIHKLKEELFIEHTLKYPECYSDEIINFYYSLKDKDNLSIREVDLISRLALREDIVCQLRHQDQFFLNHSYDYYMDIGSSIVCEAAIYEIKKLGLYIDLWDHPYKDNVWDNSLQ